MLFTIRPPPRQPRKLPRNKSKRLSALPRELKKAKR